MSAMRSWIQACGQTEPQTNRLGMSSTGVRMGRHQLDRVNPVAGPNYIWSRTRLSAGLQLERAHMTDNTNAFDRWIRTRFIELNTELEEIYFVREQRAVVRGVGGASKQTLVREGHELIVRLLDEGNTDEGFDSGFEVLGNVGLYMGACRRHEVTEPSGESLLPLKEASALAMQIGASLGVTLRFATSHLATHNRALDGVYKSFTSLEAECFFLEYNTRGILAFKRAADALVRILPLSISHPVSYDLLVTARDALNDVIDYNEVLFERLDVDRFFYCVRPYYKPFRVGLHEYRGANAGDFAGINEIDMLLGLCRADNPEYSQLLVDKFLYMMPEDQERLRDCMRRRSLLDELLSLADHFGDSPWFQKNTAMFLEVCQAHGRTAAQHHDQLVSKFIDKPSAELSEERLTQVTASGPPLPVLLRGLEQLRDLRLAADRDDLPTRHGDLQRLRALVGVSARSR